MNCRQVEKLLALYVEDDLAGRRAGEVAAHLEACDNCRRLADEFDASQNILRRYTPPQFDAAFFDDIRGRVLREIEAKASARPAFIAPLEQLFARRSFAFAASFALLLAASALLTWQHYQSSTGQTTNAIADGNRKAGDGGAPPRARTPRPDEETESVPQPSRALPPHQAVKKVQAQKAHPPSLKTPRLRRAVEPDSAPTVPRAEQATNAPSKELSPPSFQVTGQEQPARGAEPFAPETVADNRKMTRIELQTSDPNVRIIWFSPQTADTLSNRK